MNPLKVLTISSVSVWLGAMAFFSIFVAPAAFTVLDRESAGRLVTTVFPRYYLFGAVLGAQAFARLHRLSVILNGVTLLSGLALIGLEAVRSRG